MTLTLGAMGCLAIVGAVITASVTSSVPHDLIGIAIAVAGYLMGQRVGQLRERVRAVQGGSSTHAGE